MRLESIGMLIPEFTLVLRKVLSMAFARCVRHVFAARTADGNARVLSRWLARDGGILRSAGCPRQKHQLLDRMAGRRF
jgi:hypothetical protein